MCSPSSWTIICKFRMLFPADDRNFWRVRKSRKLHLLTVTSLDPVACDPRSERKGIDPSSRFERHSAPWNWLKCVAEVSLSGFIHDGAWIVATWRFLKIAINRIRELGHAFGQKRRRLLIVGMRSQKVCWRAGKLESVTVTRSRVRVVILLRDLKRPSCWGMEKEAQSSPG